MLFLDAAFICSINSCNLARKEIQMIGARVLRAELSQLTLGDTLN
jgi:hypothetical protein